MTIAEKITALQNAKDAIADAITDMGGTVSAGDGFADFAVDIATIPSGGDVTDGIVATYTGNNMTKLDIYYSHDISNLSMPTMYRKNTITQVALHPIGSAVVTGFANDCFRDLSKITNFVIPSDVTKLGDYCFLGCSSLASIDIPLGVKSIGSYCFCRCSSLTSVNIPSGVKNLSTNCFSDCIVLTSVNIPSSVTSIDSNCFSGCSSLASVNIPSGVTSIYNYCFSGCTSLEEIHFKRSTPATVSNSNAWSKVPTTCKIYVPTGSLAAYIAAANYPSASTYTYIEE